VRWKGFGRQTGERVVVVAGVHRWVRRRRGPQYTWAQNSSPRTHNASNDGGRPRAKSRHRRWPEITWFRRRWWRQTIASWVAFSSVSLLDQFSIRTLIFSSLIVGVDWSQNRKRGHYRCKMRRIGMCIILQVLVAVVLLSVLFGQPNSNLPDGQSAQRQKYISGWFLNVTRKIHSDISPTPPRILQKGGQEIQNLVSIFTFKALRFRNGATCRISKIKFGIAYDRPMIL